MKPTAKQVAHAAGVSIAAVSRAFTPGAPIDPDKRRRVFLAAEKIGYLNPALRTINALAARTVALVVGDLNNPFYLLLFDLLVKELQSTSRRLLIYTLPSGANIDTTIDQALIARPSAIIFASANLTSRVAHTCQQHRVKVVLLNCAQRDLRVNSVSCDNLQGGKDMGHFLLKRGYTKIGFVGVLSDTSTHDERLSGLREALCEGGLNIHALVSGDFSYHRAYAIGMELLSKSSRPDSIFCCNDIMALAVYDAARNIGLRVPDDLAITGFDDIPMASWSAYRLTTIRQPIERMVQETLRMIDCSDTGSADHSVTRILPGMLISRESA